MLSIIGSMQHGYTLRRANVSAETPLMLELPDWLARRVKFLRWTTGTREPWWDLAVALDASNGTICKVNLSKAALEVDFAVGMSSARTRIPGVPICDTTLWNSEDVMRSNGPVGIARTGRLLQISILEAGPPVTVYSSDEVELGVDADRHLSVIQFQCSSAEEAERISKLALAN